MHILGFNFVDMKGRDTLMTCQIVFAILIASTGSFGQKAEKKSLTFFEDAQWLIGTWENVTPRRTIFETWKKVSDSEFAGKSYAIKDKDTLVFEQVQLIQKQGDLFYIPTVNGQNDNKPVHFKSQSISASEMVFVNPEHDFPQQITYTRISGDSLHAVISGTVNGKLKSQTYKMRKLPR